MGSINLTQAANTAAQDLAIIDSGGSLSAQQLTDAFGIANTLIDSWSIDRLMANSVNVIEQALTSNQQSYVISRVSAIEGGTIKIANGPTMGVRFLNAFDWSMLEDRDSSSYLVRYGFYDRANTNPKIYLSPIPLSGVLEYLAWTALTQFADQTTPITLAPGLERVLILGLSAEMAPQYPGCQVPSTLASDYAEAKAQYRQLNASLLGPEPPGGLISPAVGQPMNMSPSGSPGSSGQGK